MPNGKVKWFNPQKGYGFIEPQDGSKDVFVHISAVESAGISNLNEGDSLSFEVVSENGKEKADSLIKSKYVCFLTLWEHTEQIGYFFWIFLKILTNLFSRTNEQSYNNSQQFEIPM